MHSYSSVSTSKALSTHIAYAREDEELVETLVEKHLYLLYQAGLAKFDYRIEPGADFKSVIQSRLMSSDVILLMISPDSISSKYFWGTEMQTALSRHEASEAVVIPVLLRHVDWSDAPFSKLQVLPRNQRPLTSWSDRDQAFSEISSEIREFIKSFLDKKERLKIYRLFFEKKSKKITLFPQKPKKFLLRSDLN